MIEKPSGSIDLAEYHCSFCDLSYWVPVGRTMFDDVTSCPLCDGNTWPVSSEAVRPRTLLHAVEREV